MPATVIATDGSTSIRRVNADDLPTISQHASSVAITEESASLNRHEQPHDVIGRRP